MIIKNKEIFLSSLLLALKSDDRVIAANKKLKRTCAKLEGINEKIKAYNFKNDDFSINVLNKLKEQQAEIIINKTNLENELLTTLNVDAFHERIKILI